MDTGNVLISAEQIADRVRELGEEISRDYAGKDLLIVGILKGSFVFLADLVRNISIPITVDFVTISSYGSGTETTGHVHVAHGVSEDITGRHVLLVEDIVDTGWTLRASRLLEDLQGRGAACVRVCALLDKPSRRKTDIEVYYKGFEVPDKFVIGYGLDLGGLYRNLPFVSVLEEEK